jgi:hypothetical protein
MLVTQTERTDRGVEYTSELVLNESGGLPATMNSFGIYLIAGSDLTYADGSRQGGDVRVARRED